MNDRSRRFIEAGQRCRQWIVDNAALIPAGSMLATKSAAFTTCVDELEVLLGELTAFSAEGLSATDVKGSERLELIALMKNVRDAARAAEPDHPGTRDRYRFTTNLSNQALLAAGHSFIAGATDDDALLESYGARSDWPALLTTACEEFETSFGQQDSAINSRVGKNAEIADKLAVMIALKSTISHMVPNFCSNDPGAIASWKSAAHIEEPPKKKEPTP